MSLTPDRLTGAADPALALLAAALHQQSAVAAPRPPDVRADERKPSVDRYVQRTQEASRERPSTTLRDLAERHRARAAAASAAVGAAPEAIRATGAPGVPTASAATASSTAAVSESSGATSATSAQASPQPLGAATER